MRISDWSSDVCSSDLLHRILVLEIIPVEVVARSAPEVVVSAVGGRLRSALYGNGGIIGRALERFARRIDQLLCVSRREIRLVGERRQVAHKDRKSTRLNSSH